MKHAAALLAALLGIGWAGPAHADRALPDWSVHRADRKLGVAVEAWARGEVVIAEAAAAEAVALDPDRLQAWTLLARTRLALGRPAEAAVAAEHLARLAPSDLDSCLLRGRLAVELGDAELAGIAYEAAEAADGSDPRPALGRALIAARLHQDWGAVKEHLREARRRDPSQPDAALPLRAAWAPLAEDRAFLAALGEVLGGD